MFAAGERPYASCCVIVRSFRRLLHDVCSISCRARCRRRRHSRARIPVISRYTVTSLVKNSALHSGRLLIRYHPIRRKVVSAAIHLRVPLPIVIFILFGGEPVSNRRHFTSASSALFPGLAWDLWRGAFRHSRLRSSASGISPAPVLNRQRLSRGSVGFLVGAALVITPSDDMPCSRSGSLSGN